MIIYYNALHTVCKEFQIMVISFTTLIVYICGIPEASLNMVLLF